MVVKKSMLLSGPIQLACPEKVALYGYGSEKTEGVYRWEDCARLCRQRVGCRYWTWYDRTTREVALQCVTMTYAHSKKYEFGAISAERNCGVDSSFPNGLQLQCPSRGVAFGYDSDYAQEFPNVHSWEECARRCRAYVGSKSGKRCKHWIWNQKLHKCAAIESVITISYVDPNESDFIAGDRTCGSRGVEGISILQI